MRTATTIGRTAKGWHLISGPDVPHQQQRLAFNNVGQHWPKDVLEVHYQDSSGHTKRVDRAKAESLSRQIAEAQEKVKAKEEIAKKRTADADAKRRAEEEAKAKADAAARAALVKSKEAAKKQAASVQLPSPKTETKP